MDLSSISSLAFSGHTLNVAERSLLKAAVVKKAIDEGLTFVGFWGKIFGKEANYLICVGNTPKFSGVPNKKFYYMVSGGENPSSELAECEHKFEDLAARGTDKQFEGVPETVLREPEDEDEDAEAYTEAHLLAYTVAAIDAETGVVPRGALVVTPSHKVIRNKTFEGLDASSAASLANYFHMRQPRDFHRLGALEKEGLVASTDFLDPIVGDIPKGSWALKFDGARQNVTLSSLKYPGYHFFHRLGTSEFGGAYFGTGQVNKDLVFMI
jgi:radial spoke head protein 9